MLYVGKSLETVVEGLYRYSLYYFGCYWSFSLDTYSWDWFGN